MRPWRPPELPETSEPASQGSNGFAPALLETENSERLTCRNAKSWGDGFNGRHHRDQPKAEIVWSTAGHRLNRGDASCC
jgi:hypothetical protein